MEGLGDSLEIGESNVRRHEERIDNGIHSGRDHYEHHLDCPALQSAVEEKEKTNNDDACKTLVWISFWIPLFIVVIIVIKENYKSKK